MSTHYESDFVRRSENPYPGTNRDLKTNTFRARLKWRGRSIYLGYFKSQQEATNAYEIGRRIMKQIELELNPSLADSAIEAIADKVAKRIHRRTLASVLIKKQK